MKIWSTKKLRELKKQLIFILRRYRSFFKITFEKGIPHFHVHEKFEKCIKWTLRILLFVTVVNSVFSFRVWHLNLLITVLLVAIEQFLERIIFIFTTIFVTPIPESYKPEDWKGMVWGFPLDENDTRSFMVAPLFNNCESAVRIFKCLKSWNYGRDKDFAENILISAIIEDKDEYSIYMYPGIERVSLKQWGEQAKKENPNREHHSLVMHIMFCKKFKYSGSNFETFRDKYIDGREFIFAPYCVKDGRAVPFRELGCVVKNRIKIKNRNELTRKDIEFEHGKFIMDL